MLRLIRALVIVAAIAAPAAAFAREKVVHVDVEGRVLSVTTYASAAPDVLRRVGHEPRGRDEVTPRGSLRPGATVRLRRAKPIELVLDGASRKVWVHGLTVGDALDELGMPAGTADYVSPQPEDAVAHGMRVELRNAVPVTVRVDGKTRQVVSSAPTIGTLLKEAHIRVGTRDRLSPPAGTAPSSNVAIRIVRVRERVEEQRIKIPFAHREQTDPKLEKGLRRTGRAGVDGLKVRKYVTVLEDGKQAGRKLVSEKLVRKPRDQVLRIGTGQPAYRGGGHSDTGGASWFRANGLTAAHRSLPIGTVVRVTNLDNGRTVNVVIRDRGPFVDGRVIDLSPAAFQEISSLGSGTARVKIEW